MRKAILMFIMMFMMAACAVDLSTPVDGVGSTEQASALKPPAPTPQFQFCDGFVTCNPYRDGNADFNCTLDCLEPAFCQDYPQSDYDFCFENPDYPDRCCVFRPCYNKRCIKGDRP